ncbi:hypothetical protein E5082_31635 [Streptomyces griseoluteus]|uniref:Uncharacterized protein n=1 Tax=Streptomyces griseoluteus TaxID=29306 RepID=A0A4Z1CX48_STRGP|nr:hypothetical protein [Streptomyces griseoluteus]TGN73558.1 hypothetical protein E5082_31635 [Streptomyces griseoluteus]
MSVRTAYPGCDASHVPATPGHPAAPVAGPAGRFNSLLEHARAAAAVIRARVAAVVDLALAAVDVTATVFVMNEGGRFHHRHRHLLTEARPATSPSSCAAAAATPSWTTELWPPPLPPTAWTSASRRPCAACPGTSPC